LLLNAVKHAETDRAKVRLEPQADGLICITVSDEGRGFDPAELERRPAGAGGFGLFSIKERLQVLGGWFELETAPGAGTLVRLFMPASGLQVSSPGVAAPSANRVAEESGLEAHPFRADGAATISVLLADDHRIVREGIAKLLHETGDIVVVAEVDDGQKAVDVTRAVRPDVVVLDVNMPVMNGIEAARAINREFPGIHILGLSIQADPETAQVMRQAGARAYFHKDGPVDELIRTIRECVRGTVA
jgi:CheY-like chemotaxis protein